MRTALFMCALCGVACGGADSRPAEDPSTVGSTSIMASSPSGGGASADPPLAQSSPSTIPASTTPNTVRAGSLVGLGIPEIEAKRYEGKIKGGNLLISAHVETSEQRKRAEDIFKAAHADDICSTTEAAVPKDKDARRNV